MFLIRRLIWFTTGATAGFGGAMWIRRQLLRRMQRLVPARVSADLAASGRRLGGRMRTALAEGRSEARRSEARLRAELRPGPGAAAGPPAWQVVPAAGTRVPGPLAGNDSGHRAPRR